MKGKKKGEKEVETLVFTSSIYKESHNNSASVWTWGVCVCVYTEQISKTSERAHQAVVTGDIILDIVTAIHLSEG